MYRLQGNTGKKFRNNLRGYRPTLNRTSTIRRYQAVQDSTRAPHCYLCPLQRYFQLRYNLKAAEMFLHSFRTPLRALRKRP